ncbi:DUF4124 domain-containing protein [bacterium SCSIO 12696]|nr:DUF4124 domain-containing protein [bacterium SCSIO 12696]
MKRPLVYVFSLLLTLLWSSAFAQQLYKVVDENGKVTFTDKKPSDHIKYETITVNTAEPDPQAVKKSRDNKKRWQTDSENPDRKKRFRGYKSVTITSPSNDATVLHDQFRVPVKLALTPGLQPKHKAQLIFDGKKLDESDSNTNFVLTDLDRGSHRIQIKIINDAGKVVASSNTVTIHVKRPQVFNGGPLAAPRL